MKVCLEFNIEMAAEFIEKSLIEKGLLPDSDTYGEKKYSISDIPDGENTIRFWVDSPKEWGL